MPIVETPEDAVLLFLFSGIDMLVVGDVIVAKPPDFADRIAKFNRMVAQASANATFKRVLTS